MTEMLGIQGISKEKLTTQPNINLKAACMTSSREYNPMPGLGKDIKKNLYNITQTINLSVLLTIFGATLGADI